MPQIQVGIMFHRREDGSFIEPGIPIMRDYPNLPEDTTMDDILSLDEFSERLADKYRAYKEAMLGKQKGF